MIIHIKALVLQWLVLLHVHVCMFAVIYSTNFNRKYQHDAIWMYYHTILVYKPRYAHIHLVIAKIHDRRVKILPFLWWKTWKKPQYDDNIESKEKEIMIMIIIINIVIIIIIIKINIIIIIITMTIDDDLNKRSTKIPKNFNDDPTTSTIDSTTSTTMLLLLRLPPPPPPPPILLFQTPVWEPLTM